GGADNPNGELPSYITGANTGNLDEAEHIYADLLAQYEKKRIARSLAYTPPGSVVRKRL
ncbi:hypothetical protein FSJ24_021115, partial [Escherichia coli]|nr:hypothetical protein [Escherichia coli]